jgi:glyoxylase-like metal-dependent hydrolase (beta-lactamase superfamily II)
MKETVDEVSKGVWRLGVDYYQSTLVLGDDGCLLIDTQDAGRAPHIWRLAQQVTSLPLAGIAYSHHHLDHIGGAEAIRQAAGDRISDDFAIYATELCADEIERHGAPAQPPTQRLPTVGGTFTVASREVQYGSLHAHTVDNTWFLIPDAKVLHCVDMVHPGRVEYEAFGMPHDIFNYESGLHTLLELDWDRLIAGHFDIGNKSDVECVLTYLDDVRAALAEAVSAADGESGTAASRRNTVVPEALERLRDKWGEVAFFDDAAWSHVNAIFWAVYVLGFATPAGHAHER